MNFTNIALVVACVIGIVYFMLIRPKLRERKAISDTRKWLKDIGVPVGDGSEQADMTSLPDGVQVIADMREYWGYPPKQDQVLEEVLSGEHVAGEWDYAVHIHEAAEQYLGSKQFSELEKRFASAPGVDGCKHEDREVFLIRTSSLDKNALRNTLWREFLEAARLAMEEDR